MTEMIRLTIFLLGGLALSACGSVPYLGDGPAAPGAGGSYAAGSAFEGQFSGADINALGLAFETAMESGAVQPWNGKRAVGEVRPGAFALGNLLADESAVIPAVRGDYDLSFPLETEQGLYVLTRNANVRTGPGTEYPIVTKLSSGDGVDIVGAVVGKDWMLAAKDGVVRGYIYRGLMIKAPGTELELAGGPRRMAKLCREFSQTASLYSQTDRWDGAACKSANGAWRVLTPSSEEFSPVYLTD